MQIRTRADQEDLKISTFLYSSTATISDAVYDGVQLSSGFMATRWLQESAVHGALRITDRAINTRAFVSLQSPIVRDELRATTWVGSNETDGLFLTKIYKGEIQERRQLTGAPVDRFSVRLRKFDGTPFVVHTAGSEVFINGVPIKLEAGNPTFPDICFDQVAVGNYPEGAPSGALLTYKSNGRLFVQPLTGDGQPIETAIALPFENTLGGLDIVIHEGIAVAKAQVIEGAEVAFHLTRFSVGGPSIEIPALQKVDLLGGEYTEFRPAGSPGFFDSSGRYHFPVVGVNDEEQSVFDIMPFDDLMTEVGKHPIPIRDSQASAFPKKPGRVAGGLDFGFGDGRTDGSGIIVTTLQDGLLLASNSQSGGYSYPQEKILNHEMPKALCFRSTECYTRGETPNTVSMDYLFVEADDRGQPIDSSIWLETWDMPLPQPQLSVSSSDDKVLLQLQADGWFIPGATAVEFSDPLVRVVNIEHVDDRKLIVTTNVAPAGGTTAVFEAFSPMFYHKAEGRIGEK